MGRAGDEVFLVPGIHFGRLGSSSSSSSSKRSRRSRSSTSFSTVPENSTCYIAFNRVPYPRLANFKSPTGNLLLRGNYPESSRCQSSISRQSSSLRLLRVNRVCVYMCVCGYIELILRWILDGARNLCEIGTSVKKL